MKDERLYALDVTRGLAALAVVFSHWRHFFYVGGSLPEGVSSQSFPGYSWLWPLYDYGWIAVDYFFVVSGFVFFWLYVDVIRDRAISFGRFAWLRLSRLYPLHFATLILVLVLQWACLSRTGEYFVYQYNDALHFILNIFFASHWGFQAGDSFNGPIWSVSVEVASYGAFFLVAFLIRGKILRIVIPLMLSLAFNAAGFNPPLAKALLLFFVGGGVHLLVARFPVRNQAASLAWLAVAAISWIVTIQFVSRGSWDAASNILGFPSILSENTKYLSRVFTSFWLFPVTVYSVVGIDFAKLISLRSVSWVGDISYASYLTHFPLQLIAHLIMPVFGLGSAVFYTWQSLLIFYAILIGLSLVVFTQFEKPAQTKMRDAFFAKGRLVRSV
jgi:peptidoglycan/LPS O-acetylase OafA/YrhL